VVSLYVDGRLDAASASFEKAARRCEGVFHDLNIRELAVSAARQHREGEVTVLPSIVDVYVNLPNTAAPAVLNREIIW
jgi:hypothetical protein